MKQFELLPRLKFLTLAGYEDGELQWIGSPDQWSDVESDINHYYKEDDRADYYKQVTQS